MHISNDAFLTFAKKSAIGIALLAGSGLAWGSTIIRDWDSAYCDNCASDVQFAAWAENHVLDLEPLPGDTIVNPVYVINPNTLQQRYFDVSVWWGGGTIQSPPEETGAGRGLIQSGQGLQKHAVLRPGDPAILAAVEESVLMVDAFFASVADIDSTDLDFEVDSAVDLVGPEDGPAGLTRASLALSVGRYLSDEWESIFGQVSDLIDRAANNYVGESTTFNAVTFRVSFPNETTALFIVTLASNNPVIIVVELVPGSLTMPDGTAVPSSPGQLEGTTSVPEGIGFDLLQMIQRFPGNSMTCSMSCDGSSGPDAYCRVFCSRR